MVEDAAVEIPEGVEISTLAAIGKFLDSSIFELKIDRTDGWGVNLHSCAVNFRFFYHRDLARPSRNQKEKADLTTKGTKSTKFMSKNIRTLRGLRDLRGENIFRHVLHS